MNLDGYEPLFLGVAQVGKLNALKDEQPPRNKEKKEPSRTVTIIEGDFNQRVDDALAAANILNNKKAAFCLLDQRTFECRWGTVRRVAEYRPMQKIELFYLMPISWLQRSLVATTKNTSNLTAWWGDKDWTKLRGMTPSEIAALMCKRFQKELGYQYAQAWPIRRSQSSRRIMYFMVHATDHPDAPKLMGRAFRKTDSRVFEDVSTMDLEEFLAQESL
jgi:three-Cys-motif partner protein